MSKLVNKHYNLRLEGARLLSKMSPCPRGQVGAVIFNPVNYAIIADGYNGPPRKGGTLCGGDTCTRACPSGTEIQIGCHHAEMNAICNAAREGARTLGMAIAITCEPCLLCAKLIHHAGIELVIYDSKGYSAEGVEYLKKNALRLLPSTRTLT